MYPNFYFLFKDLFGIEVEILKVVQTFGFFLVFAIFSGFLIAVSEMKRKTKEGIFRPYNRKVIIGGPLSIVDWGMAISVGFVIGFKVFYILFNLEAFTADPKNVLLSTVGYWGAGILGALTCVGFLYWDHKLHHFPGSQYQSRDLRRQWGNG